MTLLYNHSLQEGALHTGETNIRPRTLSRYFVCDGVHKTFLASAQQENNPKVIISWSHLLQRGWEHRHQQWHPSTWQNLNCREETKITTSGGPPLYEPKVVIRNSANVLIHYLKKSRTSATWSARASTDGRGTSAEIGAAPNCNT